MRRGPLGVGLGLVGGGWACAVVRWGLAGCRRAVGGGAVVRWLAGRRCGGWVAGWAAVRWAAFPRMVAQVEMRLAGSSQEGRKVGCGVAVR